MNVAFYTNTPHPIIPLTNGRSMPYYVSIHKERDMKKVTKPKGQALPLTAEQVSAIRTILMNSNRKRDLALFNVGIDTMLRISDILNLRVGDVMDDNDQIADEIIIGQIKTDGAVSCNLGPNSRSALLAHIQAMPRKTENKKLFDISIRQAQRLMKQWVKAIHIDGKRYSPHSLRRTKASIIYNKTKNVEAVRQLLGHKSIAATSHYLGIDRNEALNIARSIDV